MPLLTFDRPIKIVRRSSRPVAWPPFLFSPTGPVDWSIHQRESLTFVHRHLPSSPARSTTPLPSRSQLSQAVGVVRDVGGSFGEALALELSQFRDPEGRRHAFKLPSGRTIELRGKIGGGLRRRRLNHPTNSERCARALRCACGLAPGQIHSLPINYRCRATRTILMRSKLRIADHLDTT